MQEGADQSAETNEVVGCFLPVAEKHPVLNRGERVENEVRIEFREEQNDCAVAAPR